MSQGWNVQTLPQRFVWLQVCVATSNSRAALTHLITWSESSDCWLVKLCVLDWFHQACRLGPVWNYTHDFSPQMLEIIYKYAAVRQDSDRCPGPRYVIPAGIKESDSSHSSDSAMTLRFLNQLVLWCLFSSQMLLYVINKRLALHGGWRGLLMMDFGSAKFSPQPPPSGEQKAVQASAFSSLTASISSCSNKGGTCAPTVDDHISVLDLWRTRSQQVDTTVDTLEAPHDLGSLSLTGKELVLQPAGHWFRSSDGSWVGVPT